MVKGQWSTVKGQRSTVNGQRSKVNGQLSIVNCQLSINWMGFIFWPKSSRYVSQRPAYLPTQCKRVGVFVDEEIQSVRRIADEYALDYIQLHGNESSEYCAQLQGLHLIKAISVSSRNDIATYKTYEGLVEYFLFDTKCPSVGGSGQQFDWSVLSAYDGSTPFLLSGGIGPDDAERIKSFHHPQCIGIDLNSRFELAPGLKDVIKLQAFIKELSI
jgi:phosphoribosylanthranilate isomerase